MPPKNNSLTLEHNNILKGIAIFCVLTIHFLGSFPGLYSLTNSNLLLFVTIDQLSRFCVPLFVALSGYGFWEKYQTQKLSYLSFLKHQASKLLPLYVATSLLSYVVFHFVPHWKIVSTPASLLVQLLTGRADYHLYFVPMIFQFYLLFPALRFLVQKFRWYSLIVSAIFQFWFYNLLAKPPSFLLTDQQQYIWFFTWIFYFILGMHLTTIARSLKTITFLCFTILTIITVGAINNGVDPIVALRFTRLPVMLFATAAIVTLYAQVSKLKRSRLTNYISTLGAASYPIYLLHTLVLRVFFEYFVY